MQPKQIVEVLIREVSWTGLRSRQGDVGDAATAYAERGLGRLALPLEKAFGGGAGRAIPTNMFYKGEHHGSI